MSEQQCTATQLLSQADFYERLVQFFGPFVSARPVDWSCIRESVTHFDPLFKFDEFSNLYFEYVFGLFEGFRITDREAIYLYFTGYIRFKMNFTYKLLYPNGVLQRCGNYFAMESPSLSSLPSRNILFCMPLVAKRILRYMAHLITEWKDIFNIVNYVSCSVKNDRFKLDHSNTFCWESVHVQGRRLKLIIIAMYFVIRLGLENSQGSLEGFRLFFQVIPDPHVTWQEISGFLMSTLSLSESDKHELIESFRKSCEKCLPKCTRLLEPRSLKHLARCKVRSCLSAAYGMPHGVWGLGLPRELEDYILLQRPKDQYQHYPSTVTHEGACCAEHSISEDAGPPPYFYA